MMLLVCITAPVFCHSSFAISMPPVSSLVPDADSFILGVIGRASILPTLAPAPAVDCHQKQVDGKSMAKRN